MELPLNTGMMKNPYNWVILTLMVVIAGLALSLLVTPGGTPKT